jgi:hypothetical protein
VNMRELIVTGDERDSRAQDGRRADKTHERAKWAVFEASAPDLAAAARMLWPGITALAPGDALQTVGPWFSIAFLATSRPDGSPRLHPFCPILAGGSTPTRRAYFVHGRGVAAGSRDGRMAGHR